MTFLRNRHPEWQEKHHRWKESWLHYTGEYATQDHITDFLHKKVQAETTEAYEERTQVSDPQLLFPTAVDSLNGLLFGKSEDTQREWGELGDPEEESIAAKLLRNADGKGTNWEPLMKQVSIKQTVVHKVWGLVDGITDASPEASIKIIDPTSVVDWFPSTGMPTEVLVKEKQDLRSGIKDDSDLADKETYILYTVDGWTRYEEEEYKDENGDIQTRENILGKGEYAFYSDKKRTNRILPIFPVEIPMPRDIGYLLALKQNHVFNAKSIRDFSVRNMSFAFLRLVASKEQYDSIIADIQKGFRVLRQDPEASGNHGYEAPPSDYLSEAGDILDEDKKDFMESAFSTYGDAAKQVTATEIRQESRSGVEAFLTLLVSSLDEFENHCFWLLEQVYFPDNPSSWGQAFVKRSDDFQPEDINQAMEQASTTVLNLDRAGAISTYEKVRRANPSWTETEIEEEVERINKESGTVPIPENGME